MRKAQKRQAIEEIHKIEELHEEINKSLGNNQIDEAKDLLSLCQEVAIRLGTMIEETEGEGFFTIGVLEHYCEVVYQSYKMLLQGQNLNKVYKNLKKALICADNSVRNDIAVHMEAVFLPYKASMWDSMESVWEAVKKDEEFDTYVVPIPYYERDEEGVPGIFHYEGKELPDYVPVTHYEDYSLEERRPDVIYIHNPYDNTNYVTTVDPRFYSFELRKYTGLLIYIPYYVATGGMGEGQALCSAYWYVDYIIIQSEKYKQYFDTSVPKEKLLPLGSPKVDKTIRLCKNQPQPPEEWRDKLYQGTSKKKVYFYNVSIGSMLADTKTFLQKMRYVFLCFQGREDVCLLWRPHPLLESTFRTMRREYKAEYESIKQSFIEQQIGIYDDTPDIERTIAQCDAYIGDAFSSVVTLFGIVGKPIFILNPNIRTAPQEEDWRGEIIKSFSVERYEKWYVTQGNKLYCAQDTDFHYQYVCDLSEYAGGNLYGKVFEINKKAYVCPANAEDVLVVEQGKLIKRIPLWTAQQQLGEFCYAWQQEQYLFLIPYRYPAIVRLDTTNDKADYISGYQQIYVREEQENRHVGGHCIWKNFLLMASPVDNKIFVIECGSLKTQVITIGIKNRCGCCLLMPDRENIWLLPYEGTVITRWNPETGAVREYTNLPENFQCEDQANGQVCREKPFGWGAVYKEWVILPPEQGNMFICLNQETGEIEEWKPPVPLQKNTENGYYALGAGAGCFLQRTDSLGEGTYRFYHRAARKLYDIRVPTGEWKEIPIKFEKKDLYAHESGFCNNTEHLQYVCMENAINSLEDLLNGNIKGNQHDKQKQIDSWKCVVADSEGTCGEKIHEVARMRMELQV